ncbi:hypothetical protein [Paenibacillus sp. YYML68]|uniref:hypothetical protein n=1 Tax=Paenibacillus sp. YYML68 TaxID=2909250 RepID=UPI002492B897|nr:hypothetical protein [Paenibacillus sp. YYML68]
MFMQNRVMTDLLKDFYLPFGGKLNPTNRWLGAALGDHPVGYGRGEVCQVPSIPAHRTEGVYVATIQGFPYTHLGRRKNSMGRTIGYIILLVLASFISFLVIDYSIPRANFTEVIVILISVQNSVILALLLSNLTVKSSR